MRRAYLVISCILLLVLLLPVLSVFVLSFENPSPNLFSWYAELFDDSFFLESLAKSIFLAISVGIFSSVLAFILSLSWYDSRQRFIVTLLIVSLGLLPSDILGISISQVPQLFNLYNANFLFLVVGLTLYSLPFSILILWTKYYFIDDTIILAGKDLGMTNQSVVFKLLLPLSVPTLLFSFIFSFTLTLNEYPRTYYLSGAETYLSEYLYGKLNSGADNSIYAGSSVTIFLSFIALITGYVIILRLRKQGKPDY